VIFGILLVYSGFSLVAKVGTVKEIIKDTPDNTAVSFIVLEFVIFAIAYMGCCGAIRENYCMLVSFGAIIFIMLVIEFVGAGFAFAFKSDLKELATKGMEDSISHYNWNNTDDPMSKVVDDLQSNMKCCGALSFKDWDESKKNATIPIPPNSYPASCCPKDKPHDHFCPSEEVFKTSCVDAIENAVKGSVGFLAGIGVALAIIQLLGIAFACCLARAIRKEYEVV